MPVQLAEYKRSISYKNNRGRLSLAKFRQYGELVITTSYVLGDRPIRYLTVCPEGYFGEYVENVVQRGCQKGRVGEAVLCGPNVDKCDFDKQGRMTIPLRLLSHIGMSPENKEDNEVFIREVYDPIKFFEIWNVEDWEAMKRELL
jgi:DNA-binding transcriptional regulator/RsmH inhibitor MraZ